MGSHLMFLKSDFSYQAMNHRQKIKRFRQRIYALPRVRSRSLNPRCAAQIENGARWLHAFAVWRKLARQGSSDAEIQAAYFYGIAKCKGKGLPCRFGSLGGRYAEVLATACYRRAAQAGNRQGQYLLACIYHSFGTAGDTAQAIAWYEKSAVQGYGYAACNLACIYADGEGVVADYVLAEHYRRLAHQHLTDDAELAELDALVQRKCG